jgi:hypothetical protein
MSTIDVFQCYPLKDGEYECHGCSSQEQLVEIVLDNLCNQNLVLCENCRILMMSTLKHVAEILHNW